jgi:predicted 2-oxoglutarate/Fe(II)-dependent dioxygenase YbiX
VQDKHGKMHMQTVTVPPGSFIVFTSSVWHRGVTPDTKDESFILFYYWDVDKRIHVATNRKHKEDFAEGRHIHVHNHN